MGKKSFFSILFVIAGLVATGWISYFALKENKRNKQIESEISELRLEAEKLKENNEDMKEKITYFNTPEFQEKIAKEKLNLQKDNENVAIIKPSPSLRESQSAGVAGINTENKAPEKTNRYKWWEYFFKY